MKERVYPESQFGGFTDVDGTVRFYTRVNSLIDPSFVVLDLGCGRGAYQDDPVHYRKSLRILRNKVDKVIGVDPDPGARENPFIDEFHSLSSNELPLADSSLDLCLSDYVLEHVEHPDVFFYEISRVLKPGGYVCLRTTNAWHYVALIARVIPERFHDALLGTAQPDRKSKDVFETRYQCNTVGKIKEVMRLHGFEELAVWGHEPEPSYFSFSKLAYMTGVLYQKIVPRYFGATIYAFGQLSSE